MDGKDSLCKILNSLLEISKPLKRELLLDYMMGRETPGLVKKGLIELESFSCGDNKDEEHWMEVIDQGVEQGYMKVKSEGVGIMAKGKKYLKKPVEFELKGEDDNDEFDKDGGSAMLNQMVDDVVADAVGIRTVSSQRKRAIIQAIDRKIALDDFASSQGLDFDEVLKDIESLLSSGTHLDLTYFAEEVLGGECVDELVDYFNNAQTESLEAALNEFDDVYNEEELRLGRVIWRSKNKVGTRPSN